MARGAGTEEAAALRRIRAGALPVGLAALSMGGNLRVGMEDVLTLRKGVPVESNAQLVTRAVAMGELAQRMAEIPRDTDIVVYCEKGIRSVIALQRLELAGYTRLYNLTGGMRAWKEQ